MADIVSKATRSRMMSGIRGKNTKPEMVVRRLLHRRGLRFRLHDSRLPGRPDIVLPRYRAVIDVHGCFWHQHPDCRFAYMPTSNTKFWSEKLGENALRDGRNREALARLGWKVFVVWECQVADEPGLDRLVQTIREKH